MNIFKQKALLVLTALAITIMPLTSTALGSTTYPSGSIVNDGGTFYFIAGQNKIPFTNWAAFVGLGYSVRNVINGNLSNYTLSGNYMITTANAAHPFGGWLINNGTVYFSSNNGLIGVPNQQVFLSNGGNWNLVVKANAYDLANLSSSQVLSSNDSRVTNNGFAVCEYPSPPAGYHYEGGQPYPTCGAYLVKDSSGQGSITISQLSPSSGPVGSVITITGSGFTSTGNTINFGSGVIPNISSQNGTSLTFTIPSAQYPACYYTAPQCLPPIVITSTGQYNVSVTNSNGTSNSQIFNVTFTCPNNAMCSQLNAIVISSPAGGEDWATGSTHTVTWTAPSTVASVSLTLNYQGGCTYSNGLYSCNGQLPAPSTITTNAPNTGTFSWFIDPAKFYTMPVTITIKDNGTSGLTATSNSFTITSTLAGVCEYPAPPSGYHYEGGQPYPTCGAYLVKN